MGLGTVGTSAFNSAPGGGLQLVSPRLNHLNAISLRRHPDSREQSKIRAEVGFREQVWEASPEISTPSRRTETTRSASAEAAARKTTNTDP